MFLLVCVCPELQWSSTPQNRVWEFEDGGYIDIQPQLSDEL